MYVFDIFSQYLTKFVDGLCAICFFNVLSLFGVDSVSFPLSMFVLFVGFLFITFKLRFVQFTKFNYIVKYSFAKSEDKKAVPAWKTLCTAIASCTGLNTTSGMVFMVIVGGPGTVLWIPFIVFLTMPFRMCEAFLSHKYRSGQKNELGGPFDYIKKGLADLGAPKVGIYLSLFYAGLMCACGILAVPFVEMNQAVSSLTDCIPVFAEYRFVFAIGFACIIAYVVFGGIVRLTKIMSIIMPIIGCLFVAMSLTVIVYYYKNIPNAFKLIWQDAMNPKALAGGTLASIMFCVRKLSTASETGLGTGGMIHSSSSETDTMKESIRSMMTPMFQGMFMCLLMALSLVVSGAYNSSSQGIVALVETYSKVFKIFGVLFIILTPTMLVNVSISWGNYGTSCLKYIIGDKKIFLKLYLITYIICCSLGGMIKEFNLVMNLCDGMVMLLPFINVPVILALSGQVSKAYKNYNFKKNS